MRAIWILGFSIIIVLTAIIAYIDVTIRSKQNRKRLDAYNAECQRLWTKLFSLNPNDPEFLVTINEIEALTGDYQ